MKTAEILQRAVIRYDVESRSGANLTTASVDDEYWYFSGFDRLTAEPYGYLARRLVTIQKRVRSLSPRASVHRDYSELATIDLATGDVERLERFPCGYPGASLSADGTAVAYRRFASCIEEGDGELVGADATLVVRDLRTGNVADLDEWGSWSEWSDHPTARVRSDVGVSPSGRRVSVFADVNLPAGRNESYHVLDADRTMRTLELRRFVGDVLVGPRRVPRWLDDDHIFLRYETGYDTRYLDFGVAVVMNVNDGSVAHEFFVPPFSETLH